MFSDNFVTSAKFLGSGMKWETSELFELQGVHHKSNKGFT